MQGGEKLSLEQIRALLKASQEVRFAGHRRAEVYAWVGKTLREQGYANCCLHFASDNPSGAPYWLGQGFVPVEHTMVRRIDERIAWAGVG